MFSTNMHYCGSKSLTYARYNDLEDLRQSAQSSDWFKKSPLNDERWAGGSKADFLRRCAEGNVKYMQRSDKLIEEFGNSAVQGQAYELDYNPYLGIVDTTLMQAGNPNCLHGPIMQETVKAPVKIYMDMWISSTCSTRAIENRGIAALALARALSLFRPVMLDIVLANRHTPSNTDCVQVVPAPTTPFDAARACFMIADPCFVRAGLMRMLFHHAKSIKDCGIPSLSAGISWQSEKLGRWLADNDGIEEFVMLPLMFDNGEWGSEAYAKQWVKDQVDRFANT